MDNIKNILSSRMNQNGLKKPLEAAKIVFLANSIDNRFQAKKYKNKTLFCEVDKPKDMVELKLHTQLFIKEINSKINQKLIERIVWRLKRSDF